MRLKASGRAAGRQGRRRGGWEVEAGRPRAAVARAVATRARAQAETVLAARTGAEAVELELSRGAPSVC